MREGERERRIRALYDRYRDDLALMRTPAERWHLWFAYRAAAYRIAMGEPRAADLVRQLFGSEP